MQTLVITGISRGIGLATATHFLNREWRVIGTSTQGETPLAHPNLTIFSLDLAESTQINDFAERIGSLDVLINCAGVLLENWTADNINLQQLKDTFAINVFGAIQLTELCIPKFKNHGQIINITSGWGSFSSNNSSIAPHYKMSKVCMNMYTKILSERLPHITVSSFDPGWVKTDMGTNKAPKLPQTAAKEIYALVMKDKPSGLFWHEGKVRDW